MKTCIHFPECGGCTWLNRSYEEQLAAKQIIINQLFSSFKCVLPPVIQSPVNQFYRHKVQLPFGFTGRGKTGKPLLGCYARDSHKVVDQKMCCIQDQDLSAIAWVVRDWARRTNLTVYNEATGKGFLRHVLLRRGHGTGEVLIGLVTSEKRTEGSRQLSRMLLAMIEKLTLGSSTVVGIVQNVNTRHTNVVLGTEESVWWGRPYIKEHLGTLRYKIGLSTFFQVNPFQTPQLYNEVARYVPQAGKVVDLYCGVGSIALWIAASCTTVTGIEENRDAVDAARAAAKVNNCTNVQFRAGDAEMELGRIRTDSYTCAIVDPPRKGISPGLVGSFGASDLARIIYVSCNPESLKRDMCLLSDHFHPKLVQGVDMFPHTEHIECVAVLDRK